MAKSEKVTSTEGGLSRRDLLKRAPLIGAGVAGAALALSSAPQPASAMAALRKTQSFGDGKDVQIWKKIPVPEQVPATEGFADTPGVKLWYWDTGGEGETIVLLHPWSQSSLVFKYQQPALAKAGYRVVALSRRGAYKSPRSPEGDNTSAAEDVLNLVDFLGIDKFHLVGCAAGGVTALYFACAYQERLLSLVMSGTIGLPTEEEWSSAFDLMRMSDQAIGDERGMQPVAVREMGGSYRFGNPDGAREWAALEELARPNGLYSGQPWGPKDVTWEVMEAMAVPTLLATGEADGGAPPAMQRMFAQHIPNHELQIISEAGHASYWEQPEVFNDMILGFVGRNGA